MKKYNLVIFMSISSFIGYACERSSLVSNEIMCEYENEMGDASLDCDIECPRGQILQLGECVTEDDVDQDLDGVPDEIDNCLTIQNPDQNQELVLLKRQKVCSIYVLVKVSLLQRCSICLIEHELTSRHHLRLLQIP